MSGAVNAVVNNLSERLGEVVEVVGPVIKTVGDVSQTVVQETASAGFIYSMVGIGLVVLGFICLMVVYLCSKMGNRSDMRIASLVITLCLGIASVIKGLITIMVSLDKWIAPTKHVVLEVLEKIQ